MKPSRKSPKSSDSLERPLCVLWYTSTLQKQLGTTDIISMIYWLIYEAISSIQDNSSCQGHTASIHTRPDTRLFHKPTESRLPLQIRLNHQSLLRSRSSERLSSCASLGSRNASGCLLCTLLQTHGFWVKWRRCHCCPCGIQLSGRASCVLHIARNNFRRRPHHSLIRRTRFELYLGHADLNRLCAPTSGSSSWDLRLRPSKLRVRNSCTRRHLPSKRM